MCMIYLDEVHIDQISTGWEQLTVEISQNTPGDKKYLISNSYRPPERYVVELDLFICEFANFIDSLRGLNRVSYICGDFAINLLEITSNRSKYANEHFESICSRGFFPRIRIILFWIYKYGTISVTIIYNNKHDSRINPRNRYKDIRRGTSVTMPK